MHVRMDVVDWGEGCKLEFAPLCQKYSDYMITFQQVLLHSLNDLSCFSQGCVNLWKHVKETGQVGSFSKSDLTPLTLLLQCNTVHTHISLYTSPLNDTVVTYGQIISQHLNISLNVYWPGKDGQWWPVVCNQSIQILCSECLDDNYKYCYLSLFISIAGAFNY